MTEPRDTRRGPAGALPVMAVALGAFLILLAFLSLQMRTGRDPAVRPTAAAQPPKRIVERRIIERRVIITDAPAAVARGSASPTGVARVAAAPASAPVARAAPVQAAPVAPAPPPAPAPVTRTS